MQPAPRPQNDKERIRAVRSLHILDTPTEERFDQITREAAAKLNAPICTISIIDENREWLKSCVGTDVRERSRDMSFCGYTIVRGSIFVIEDTLQDPRFSDNPQVAQPPHIRFYAGITLHEEKTHLPIGAFCIKDIKPRTLNTEEMGVLLSYAQKAEKELNKEKKGVE